MSMRSPAVPGRVSAELRTALCAIGFTAVVGQVVLLRELLIAAHGNELSLGMTLALWLLWTALGSAVLAKLFLGRNALHLLAVLQAVAPIALMTAVIVARSSRWWWSATTGELAGPAAIASVACFSLGAFCPLTGWMFAAGARAYSQSGGGSIAAGGSATYLLEAAGSALGGLLAGVLLVRTLSSLQIVALLTACSWLVVSLLVVSSLAKRVAIVVVLAIVCVFAMQAAARWEAISVARNWPGFHVIATETSPYGALAVIEAESNRSLQQNGIVLFTARDQAAVEEAVHLAMLEHAAPQSVLLIGGGASGSVAEILRYRSVTRVDYVELDPSVLRAAEKYFSQGWSSVAGDARVHTHFVDGRRFVKTARRQFDVILVNVPDPQTAQLNRFYTQEFFRELRARLTPSGVVALQLHGAEEYISPELAAFLASITTTLEQVFPDVVAIPGETIHLFASPAPGVLTTDAAVLLRRLDERSVPTIYVREYFLPYRMTPARVAELREQLQAGRGRINRDFAPAAYYLNAVRWSAQFSPRYATALERAASVPFSLTAIAFLLAAIAIAGLTLTRRLHSQRGAAAALAAVTVTGGTQMGAEVLLLLGFQVTYGYVFEELAIIVAGFMTGMALGSWLAIHQSPERDLRRVAVTQVAVALSPLVVVFALRWLAAANGGGAVHLVIPCLAAGCGLVGGYQFPVAMRIASAGRASAGKLYGFDLAGAAVGALVISAYLLPIFGFERSAVLLLLVNLGPLSAAAWLSRASIVARAKAA